MKTSNRFVKGIVIIGLLAIIIQPVSIAAQQRRFYMAPDDHTDYFWIADDVAYRQAFLTISYVVGNPKIICVVVRCHIKSSLLGGD